MGAIQNILIFCPPFSGHLNVIKKLILDNPERSFKLVITGWRNIPADIDDTKFDIVHLAHYDLHETDPGAWTLPRSAALLGECLDIAKQFQPDLILYDFFSLEGCFVGRLSDIPAWSLIPALIGPYEQQDYVADKLLLPENAAALDLLRERYNLTFSTSDFELVSDGLHMPGDVNLIWSYESVVPADFLKNRHNKPYLFLGNPHDSETHGRRAHDNATPTILISFGTVVMGNLWDNQPEVRDGITSLIEALAELWKDRSHKVVLVTQGRQILGSYPDTWVIKDTVDQPAVLQLTDVFITHGGSNSFHESLVAGTPMVAIPFFGDQPLVARTIERLHAGINLIRGAEIDTHAKRDYLGATLAPKLDEAVTQILSDNSYLDSLHLLDRSHAELTDILSGKLPFSEGDLLFGTNVARKKYVDENDLQNEFTILEFKAFSELAPHKTALPRIVDIYHDVILNDEYFSKDTAAGMETYAKHLQEYKSHLAGETDFEKMCIKGIEYFSKFYHIHFILDQYDPSVNRVTYAEIEYILAHHSRLESRVTFYRKEKQLWMPQSIAQVRALQEK